MNEAFEIRQMTSSDLEIALDWAAAEGWNPGLTDAASFFAADSGGFFMGFLDSEPVSSISAVRYGDSFAFLGLYIVKPGFRGKGYGLQTWREALRTLEGRTVGLDGVVERQSTYEKSGFHAAHRNIRFEGIGGTLPSSECEDALEVPMESLLDYDRERFRAPRSSFLHSWLKQPGTTALVCLRDSRVTGYGAIRKCRSGFKMGPLFADDPKTAEILFCSLGSHAHEDVFFLDVPAVNKAALDLAARHNMKKVFETARMYAGEPHMLPLERIYGITTFELG
jgi:GNAT superfamily N-acetyltransferase